MSLIGVSIDSLCRPASSPQAIAAGCTGSDGAALTDSSTACEMCSGGFFLFRGGCYKIGQEPGSEICTKAEGGRCTTCKTEGSYIFQNPATAVTLGNECILCSDITSRDGYQGVANCNTCTTPQQTGPATCSACQEGYFLSGQTCTKCANTCATCTAASTCTSCSGSKYLKSDGTCVSACESKFYADPQSNKCISCSAQEDGIENCDTCEYDATKGKPKCLTCTGSSNTTPRTSLDGTSACVEKTIDGCQGTDKELFMKDDTTCTLCAATGSGNDEGTANCKTCTKTSGNKPVCDTCKEGYYLDSSKACQACTGANCATCTEATKDKCDTCKPGFFLKDTSSGECVSCDDTAKGGIDGCAECTNAGTFKCTKCKPNYRQSGLDPVTCTKTCEDETACGGTAGACGAIVINANGEMTYYCSLCADNSQYPIDGICNNNNAGNTCNNGVCTQRTNGYFLYMGGCYKVDTAPGSLMCTAAPNGICTITTSQYFKIPGATAGQQSVLACENPVGTTVDDNAYVGLEGCKTCTAPSEASPAGMASAKCTACDGGKALTGSGYGCVTCSVPGCSTCRADNACEACSDGYRLEGETCVRTGGNLSTGAIAGISVAAVVVVGGLVGFLCWWFICRGKA